ncbi:MAG TPA: winged helix-turn-helix transcriptional regulator [Anaerolineaceae bacterium]|nr:winged helix-turn-helix transcriptional regulator [Anaerolineaceae bacterium]
MKSTRDRILQTLLSHPRSTITELADSVGINAISVRHHLTSLQADSLVAAEEERHGVGRPRLVYFLTEKGLERFPTRYLSLTNRLLDQLKETMPQPTVNGLFVQMATNLAASYAFKSQAMSLEEKLDVIKELLAQEGFSVEWEKQGDKYHIHEITCPYYHIGQSHPEVCSIDQTVISKMLSLPTEKIECILRGDNHCTYVIPNLGAMENIK